MKLENDLKIIPERLPIYRFSTPVSRPPSAEPLNTSIVQQDQHNSTNQTNSGLRRVCSLSDLTKNSSGRRMLPAPPLAVSGKKPSTSRLQPKSIMANASRPSSSGKQQYREPTSQHQLHNQSSGSQPRKNSISGSILNAGPQVVLNA